LLFTDNRKKVLTDPRLSKSKSPSSSGNRWYTGDDEVDTIPSMWHGGGVGHSHHTTTNELSPPLLYHDDASSVSVSFTENIGCCNTWIALNFQGYSNSAIASRMFLPFTAVILLQTRSGF